MIPKQLNYQNKVEGAAARSYKSNIAPQTEPEVIVQVIPS